MNGLPRVGTKVEYVVAIGKLSVLQTATEAMQCRVVDQDKSRAHQWWWMRTLGGTGCHGQSFGGDLCGHGRWQGLLRIEHRLLHGLEVHWACGDLEHSITAAKAGLRRTP